MNKVILTARMTKDVEIRFTNAAEPVAIGKFSIAVNRRFKKEGKPDVDFINCVIFGKSAENLEKFTSKGDMVSVSGRMEVSSWDDQNGNKRYATDVVVEEFTLVERKGNAKPKTTMDAKAEGFYPIDEDVSDDDLPF
jgi:single-strand DNA-binding protein